MVNQNTLFKAAEVELTYKPNYKPSERPQISTAKQAHEVFIAHWSLGKIELIEEFKILLLNRRNRVLGIFNLSMGGITETLADPKIIFAVALKSGASGIILCLNHPSEELQPGQSDSRTYKETTTRSKAVRHSDTRSLNRE